MNRLRRQQLVSQSRAWIPYAVLGGALIVTFLAALYVHRTAQAKDRARFESSVQQISTTLDNRMDTYVALLRASTGLFAASWFSRRRNPRKPTAGAIALSVSGMALAAVTGWLGGELVDRLGVGVDEGAHLDAPSSLRISKERAA